MYFDTKSYLKSTRNYTAKHALKITNLSVINFKVNIIINLRISKISPVSNIYINKKMFKGWIISHLALSYKWMACFEFDYEGTWIRTCCLRSAYYETFKFFRKSI